VTSASQPGPHIVVGAGMAGLGAAQTLRRAGKEVIVLERTNEVGGLARTVDFEGHVFDVGPHYFFLDVSEEVNALIKSCVREEEWRPIDFKIGAKIGRANVAWPPTAREALKLPISGIASYLKNCISQNIPKTYVARDYMRGMFGKKMWSIFLEPYIEKKVPGHGGPGKLHRDWWNQAARTVHNVPDVKRDKVLQFEPALVESYLERYPSVRQKAEEAKASGTSEPPPPKGAKRILKIIQGLTKTAFAKNYKKVLYPPGGVGVICERLAEDYQERGGRLELKAANVAFEMEGPHVSSVSWSGGRDGKGGRVENPASVTWTGSLHRMCSLAGIDRQDLPFMTILLGLLKIRRPLRPGDDLYTYIADKSIVFNRIYYPNRSVGGLCPPDKDSLCVEITRPEFRDEEERKQLIGMISSGLAKLGVCKPEDIEDVRYMFVPDSYPVYPLDYREKLDRIWTELDKIDNLRSIGRSGQFWYNNMARSLRVGLETGQDILGTYEP
jgi:protoporphyrinogen oxidase